MLFSLYFQVCLKVTTFSSKSLLPTDIVLKKGPYALHLLRYNEIFEFSKPLVGSFIHFGYEISKYFSWKISKKYLDIS